MKKTAILSLLLSLLASTPSPADDGAASIAAGGIVMGHEPRITMAKELLKISPTTVSVEYEFRNDSDSDVTTEVAFPIPEYVDDPDGPRAELAGFDDFKLWINSLPTTYKIEARAFTEKGEITKLLAGMGIDAASFGHERFNKSGDLLNDLRRLSKSQRQKLIAMGAIDSVEDLSPNWSVKKKYYWTQTFPAHQVVHIQHRYTPVLGGTNSVRYGLEGEKLDRKGMSTDDKYTVDEIKSLCLDPALSKSLLVLSERNDMSVPFNYVDFILTTANTWKTPIEDFTLIVERPSPDKPITTKPPAHPRPNESLVSFCWDGPVEKTDATHFTAHLTNFVPKKELRVGFIDVDQTDPE